MSEVVVNAVLAVIGDEFLLPKAPRCLYHSKVVSIFLSNTLDMLPDYKIFMRVAAKCIKQEFTGVDVLHGVVKRYRLKGSEYWVAILFSVHFFNNRSKYVKMYDSFKIAIEVIRLIITLIRLVSMFRLNR